MTRRTVLVLLFVLAALVPATAVQAAESKAAVLARWTQPTAASTDAWNEARTDRASWASYNFDWSTDLCTLSPERPLGFDFTNACTHHDFGYRNFGALGVFNENKARVDEVFHADMRRVCATYGGAARVACNTVAWIYYQGVRIFGSLASVRKADLDQAKAEWQRASAVS